MSSEVFADRNAKPSEMRLSENRSNHSIFLGNAFAFLIPMLMFMEVQLVGRLFLIEILLLCMLPFLLMTRGQLLFANLPKKLILLGLGWLLSQIVTDFIRATPFEDWSRGWSKIVFFLLNFLALYLYLNGKEKRIFMFAVGIVAGQILAYFLNPNIYAEGLPWKFGYGTAITLFVVLASQIKAFEGRKLLSSTIILGVGALNIYMGFRSLGLICLLVALFVAVKQSNRLPFKKMKRSKVAMLILLGCFTIYGIAALYGYSANKEWLGDEAREKYLIQSSGDLGILVGGRTEILASSQAIIDSPIIGHGSWAKNQGYADLLMYALGQQGYNISGETQSDLIPTHSYIIGAWVEAGIFGAIFWLWALVLTARALHATYYANSAMAPLIAFVAFNLLWNIPFSPFGAEARLYTAYYLVLMIFALTVPTSSVVKKVPT
jgi:hypothetical protein